MIISEDNRIVNGLWIGRTLSALELLTIKSFLNNGHDFHLWVYNELETPLPPGIQVMDANHVLPEDKIFRYKNKDQYGHGKGSLAGFSDIFRYKLLYDHGGWWVDMDVTCLKPLQFETPYVFRIHHELKMVGNVMKCPRGSELMKRCFKIASEKVTADNRDWNLPIQILNDGIKDLGLEQYILDISNQDSWLTVKKFIIMDFKIPESWYVIHWVNEEWNRNGINKDFCGNRSLLRKLLLQNGIQPVKFTINDRLLTRYKLSTVHTLSSLTSSKYFIINIFKMVLHYCKSFLNRLYWFFKKLWLRYGTWAWGFVDYYIRKYSNKKRQSPLCNEASMLTKNDKIKIYRQLRHRERKDPLCFAPYRNLFFGFEGKVIACCFNRTFILGNYPQSTIHDIWTGKPIRRLKHYLKNNDLSHGCHNCNECILSGNYDATGASFYDYYAKENDFPVKAEFELSNQCNLECIMCDGEYSSKIRIKREKLTPIHEPYGNDFIDQLRPFVPHLKVAKFLGGEPFLIDSYYRIWELIISSNPDCLIDVQTNATILNNRVRDILEKGNFQIGVSIDSLKKEIYEQIRVNAKFEKVLQNIYYFAEYSKRKNLTMHISICPMRMNWPELPRLIEFSNKLGAYIYCNYVWRPARLALWNLSSASLTEIIQSLEIYTPSEQTIIEEQNKKIFNGFLNQLNAWRNKAFQREDIETQLNQLNIYELKKMLSRKIIQSIKDKMKKCYKADDWQYINYESPDNIFDKLPQDIHLKNALIELNKIPVDIISDELRVSTTEEGLRKLSLFVNEFKFKDIVNIELYHMDFH